MDVQLKVVQGKQKGHLLTFPAGEFLFGRGPECHVRPDSPLVSRQHCLMRVGSDSVWLRDLGSANGTLINDSLVTSERLLRNGDQVQLGPVVLEVILPQPASEAVMEAVKETASGKTLQNAITVDSTLTGV